MTNSFRRRSRRFATAVLSAAGLLVTLTGCGGGAPSERTWIRTDGTVEAWILVEDRSGGRKIRSGLLVEGYAEYGGHPDLAGCLLSGPGLPEGALALFAEELWNMKGPVATVFSLGPYDDLLELADPAKLEIPDGAVYTFTFHDSAGLMLASEQRVLPRRPHTSTEIGPALPEILLPASHDASDLGVPGTVILEWTVAPGWQLRYLELRLVDADGGTDEFRPSFGPDQTAIQVDTAGRLTSPAVSAVMHLQWIDEHARVIDYRMYLQ